LRNKINVDDFSYASNKKLYSFLKNLAENIDSLLDEYEESQDQAFIWRGLHVREVRNLILEGFLIFLTWVLVDESRDLGTGFLGEGGFEEIHLFED